MGFLDKLLGKAVADSIGQAIRNAVDSVNTAAGTDSGTQSSSPAPSAAPAQQTREEEYDYDCAPAVTLKVKHNESFTPVANAIGSSNYDHGSAAYFEDIIRANLPEMDISRDVPLSSVSGDSPAKQMPITLLLRRGGAPVLAILLVDKDRYRVYSVLNTLNSCEGAGIPAIRFMKEFRNDPGYVVGRIRAVAR